MFSALGLKFIHSLFYACKKNLLQTARRISMLGSFIIPGIDNTGPGMRLFCGIRAGSDLDFSYSVNPDPKLP